MHKRRINFNAKEVKSFRKFNRYSSKAAIQFAHTHTHLYVRLNATETYSAIQCTMHGFEGSSKLITDTFLAHNIFDIDLAVVVVVVVVILLCCCCFFFDIWWTQPKYARGKRRMHLHLHSVEKERRRRFNTAPTNSNKRVSIKLYVLAGRYGDHSSSHFSVRALICTRSIRPFMCFTAI